MAATYHLSQETALADNQPVIQRFWQQTAQEGHLIATDGVKIAYAALRQSAPAPAILLVNGRVESYRKYQELAWDLWQQGYSLYLIDHRGQGRSDRLLSDPHKGYVAAFSDYVTDLKQLQREVIAPDQPT
ncbi:MAG: alpha/beta fold hydrolase, partial [Aeromonas sp.]